MHASNAFCVAQAVDQVVGHDHAPGRKGVEPCDGGAGLDLCSGACIARECLPQQLGNDFTYADLFLACDFFGGAQNVHFDIKGGSHVLLRDVASLHHDDIASRCGSSCQKTFRQSVRQAAVGAGVCALALQRQGDLFAKFTHPADLAGGHANHEGVGFDVFVDYSPCAHKGVFTDGDAADYGAVGAEGGTFLDQGVAVFVFALDEGSRVVYVSEDHAGAAEHAFFERDVVVHADVVLHFAAVADGDLVAHEHVLAEGHAFAYFCAATHMDKVPDAGAFADLCALVHDGAGVDGGSHGDGRDGLAQAYNEGVDFALLALDYLGRADHVDGFDTMAGIDQAIAAA